MVLSDGRSIGVLILPWLYKEVSYLYLYLHLDQKSKSINFFSMGNRIPIILKCDLRREYFFTGFSSLLSYLLAQHVKSSEHKTHQFTIEKQWLSYRWMQIRGFWLSLWFPRQWTNQFMDTLLYATWYYVFILAKSSPVKFTKFLHDLFMSINSQQSQP